MGFDLQERSILDAQPPNPGPGSRPGRYLCAREAASSRFPAARVMWARCAWILCPVDTIPGPTYGSPSAIEAWMPTGNVVPSRALQPPLRMTKDLSGGAL